MYNTTKILKKVLKEELSDIPIRTILEHRTNFSSLKEILESGGLKGNQAYHYSDKSGVTFNLSLGRKGAFPADSTIQRDPEDYQEKSADISPNIGFVSFEIFKDRVLGSHLARGIKHRPIAEYPDDHFSKITSALSNTGISNKKKKANEILRNIKSSNKEEVRNQFREKYEDIYSRMSEFDFKNITFNIAYYNQTIKPEEKEKEERFYSRQKKVFIPLDKRLMRIRILPGFKQEISFQRNRVNKEKLLSLINKNKSLFVEDENFKELIKFLSGE